MFSPFPYQSFQLNDNLWGNSYTVLFTLDKKYYFTCGESNIFLNVAHSPGLKAFYFHVPWYITIPYSKYPVNTDAAILNLLKGDLVGDISLFVRDL